MQTNDTNLDLEEDIEYLKQLQEWAAGSNEHYVPELLTASLSYSGSFEDDLINQLMKRLYDVEKQPRIWLQYAHSILPVYKKAKNDTIKLNSYLTFIALTRGLK